MKTLLPCPKSPNCVCSDDAGSHYIAPFRIRGDAQVAWHGLAAALNEQAQFEMISVDGEEISACARTRILGFIDDLSFLLRSERNEIAIRSASRLGFWDLGTNRQRLESLRRTLQQANLIDADK